MVLKVRTTQQERKKESGDGRNDLETAPLPFPFLSFSTPTASLSTPIFSLSNRSCSPWTRTTASSSLSARHSSSKNPTRRSRPCRPASGSSAASWRGSRKGGRGSGPTRTRARRGVPSCSSRRSGRTRRRQARARAVRVVALRQEERRLSPRHDGETERAREREREEKKRKNQNLVIQERAELSPPPFPVILI